MNRTEQPGQTALPLAAAAARMGISPDALRMRMRRGKAEGFKRAGRLFVYPGEQPDAPVRTTVRTDERTGPERRPAGEPGPNPSPNPCPSSEPVRDRNEIARTAEEDPGAGPGGAPEQAVPVIIEFQKIEITRLLRDNTRLNQRLDHLMEEIRHLHEMQQREQVLRQQDQALRQQTQGMIERLTGCPSLPATPPATVPATPSAAPPAGSDGGDDGAQTAARDGEPGAEPEPPPAPGEIARSTPAAPRDPPYAYAVDEASEAGEASGTKSGAGPEGAPSAAEKLAEILTLVEEPLRPRDAASARGRGRPPTLSSSEVAPEASPEAPPGDEVGRLLEILGRMGPSTEDRRTAARLMKRLLRSRGATRPREPES